MLIFIEFIYGFFKVRKTNVKILKFGKKLDCWLNPYHVFSALPNNICELLNIFNCVKCIRLVNIFSLSCHLFLIKILLQHPSFTTSISILCYFKFVKKCILDKKRSCNLLAGAL